MLLPCYRADLYARHLLMEKVQSLVSEQGVMALEESQNKGFSLRPLVNLPECCSTILPPAPCTLHVYIDQQNHPYPLTLIPSPHSLTTLCHPSTPSHLPHHPPPLTLPPRSLPLPSHPHSPEHSCFIIAWRGSRC